LACKKQQGTTDRVYMAGRFGVQGTSHHEPQAYMCMLVNPLLVAIGCMSAMRGCRRMVS
jgi:hypothetical protein